MKYLYLIAALLMATDLLYAQQPVADTSFWQEYHEAYPVGANSAENEVRSIAIDSRSDVWIATAAGILRKKDGAQLWRDDFFNDVDKGPAYAVVADDKSGVWMGTWKGVFLFKDNVLRPMPGTVGPISAICNSDEGVYAIGPSGIWLYNGTTCIKKDYAVARSVRGIISDKKQGIWVASDVGLYHCNAKETKHFYGDGVLLSAALKSVELDNEQQLWTGGLGGVTIIKQDKRVRVIRPEEGCPSIFATSVKRSPDGTMWIGTHVGVVRYKTNGTHSLLFSRRWLLDDQVNDIAFDKEGNAWIATPKGVSAIKRKKMNLAGKENYFYDVQMKRHMRAPWISGQCRLTIPGDINSWKPDDDDNDGEFTSNYLALESFRYAATKSEDARLKARKAFDFLKQLQDVTGSNGYFARTIVPIDWDGPVHDPNREYTEKEKIEELVKEPRFKPIEIRWRKSVDGKWLWKGDASSDEMCGHMMGYYFYYELAADKSEKEMIRKHVASIVDHLIANDFNMMDIDGTATRWSVWSPASLNHDPEWRPDQSQNSMEMLTFLKLAYYLTGDIKYQNNYLKLINEEHYLENMSNLLKQDPAWFVYFDVILQAYLYPILIHCEKDPKLLAFYKDHAAKWFETRRKDNNPLVDFLYFYATQKSVDVKSSVDFMRDTPLDLVNWGIDHTKREDIRMVRNPILDELQVSELPPASIRMTIRWDRNPWTAANGYPDIEREPVFWLLPYWMARYFKMIQ